jgi:surface antigen
MPLYYFHQRLGPRVQLDGEGRDCADLAEAKRHAIDHPPSGEGDDWRIEIADAGGQHVATIDPSGVVAD